MQNPEDQSDSDSEDILYSAESSGTENMPLAQLVGKMSDHEVNEDSAIEQTGENIEIGSWVVVEYITKKTVQHFVRKIISKNIHQEVEIKFLKKHLFVTRKRRC